jgi:hypothetical protein
MALSPKIPAVLSCPFTLAIEKIHRTIMLQNNLQIQSYPVFDDIMLLWRLFIDEFYY